MRPPLKKGRRSVPAVRWRKARAAGFSFIILPSGAKIQWLWYCLQFVLDKFDTCRYDRDDILETDVEEKSRFSALAPAREPGGWKRAGYRKPNMASELRGRGAGALNLRRVRPLPRQAVTAAPLGVPRRSCKGRPREGAANQGGTAGFFARPCFCRQGRAFCFAPAQPRAPPFCGAAAPEQRSTEYSI